MCTALRMHEGGLTDAAFTTCAGEDLNLHDRNGH